MSSGCGGSRIIEHARSRARARPAAPPPGTPESGRAPPVPARSRSCTTSSVTAGAGGAARALPATPRQPCAGATTAAAGACLEKARVALAREQLAHFRDAEIRRHRHGKLYEQARIPGGRGARAEFVADALGARVPHRLAAAPAVQRGGAREQQLQVIVQLGHRADGRARGAHRVRLVDGDRRRDAGDASRPAACPCGRGTAARRARRSRRSGADLPRTACRTPARTCPSRTRRSPRISSLSGISRSRFFRLFWRAPRSEMASREALGHSVTVCWFDRWSASLPCRRRRSPLYGNSSCGASCAPRGTSGVNGA